MVTYSHDPIPFMARGRARKGLVTPVPCGRCGRLLTDAASIMRGYGDECAAQVVSERAVIVAWPVGTQVRITGGLDEGRTGTIVRVMPKKACPVRVSIDGHMYLAWYPVHQLERIGGDSHA